MNLRSHLLVAAFASLLLNPIAVRAQTAPTPPPPAARPTVVSPEVRADRTVVFRVWAPNAQKVTLSGEWSTTPVDMTKEANGVWSVTVGPIEPNLWGYNFNLDGFGTIDPTNLQVKPARSQRTSLVDVPAATPGAQDFQDVPHGTVHMHWYRSKALGAVRRLHVYTPPGYEQNTKADFPTLYLLHGNGDNDASWLGIGRVNTILDNLIAQGKAKPMIIVLADSTAVLPAQVPAGVDPKTRNIEGMRDDLLGDILPLIETTYRVRRDAAHRAILGVSMGGGEALQIGIERSDVFGWVAACSPGLVDPDKYLANALKDSVGLNARLKMLWFASGKPDQEASAALAALLEKNGVKYTLVPTGLAHSWPVFRRFFIGFAPTLFSEKP